MVKKNLFNPTGLMLLYSIFMLSQFDRVVGLMPEQIVMILSSNMSIMAIVTEITAFVPPVLLYWLYLRKNKEKSGWVSFAPLRFWPFIGSVALWVPIAALIINIGVFMGVDNGLINPRTVIPNLNIFATCIVPAVLEELFMRGAILTSVRRGGKPFAIFFSAVCFAMLHGNMHNFLGPFLAGLVFAIMTVLTGSVVPAIGAHFINNAFSFYASSVILSISNQISMEIILFTIIVVFLLLTYVALSQFQNILLYNEVAEEKKSDSKQRQGTIFVTLSSIPVLGYLLFFFYNAGMIFGPL